MENVVDLLFYRGIERWMVVVGGLIYAYLGYRLFLYGVDKGNGKLETENQFFKVTFSGSGPGLFFMAFGALILMSSVYSAADWSQKTTTPAPATAAPASAAPSTEAPTTTGNANLVAQASTTESKLHFATPGGDDCNSLRLSQNGGDASQAIEIYQNSTTNPKIANLGQSLARLDPADLAAILPGIEALICD